MKHPHLLFRLHLYNQYITFFACIANRIAFKMNCIQLSAVGETSWSRLSTVGEPFGDRGGQVPALR